MLVTPGIATGMNYGVHNLPFKEIRKISKNLDEVLVSQEDIDWENI